MAKLLRKTRSKPSNGSSWRSTMARPKRCLRLVLSIQNSFDHFMELRNQSVQVFVTSKEVKVCRGIWRRPRCGTIKPQRPVTTKLNPSSPSWGRQSHQNNTILLTVLMFEFKHLLFTHPRIQVRQLICKCSRFQIVSSTFKISPEVCSNFSRSVFD